ncbi:MAG: hypothetical protein AAGH89_09410 [Verrucomicrobiota bacterium]
MQSFLEESRHPSMLHNAAVSSGLVSEIPTVTACFIRYAAVD